MPDTSLFRVARGLAAAGMFPAIALAGALFAQSAASAPSAEDIGVVRAGGQVTITASGIERAAKAGTILPLPSALQTGRDGSADLRQGPTTIGVGPDTRLDFPAPTDRESYDRVVQPGGQAFYDVGPRGSRKLRVETPYLVAVIKGTQFNVVVADDSTTISLFEGSIELLAPDGGPSVHLNAGEIAFRLAGENAIRVIPMKDDAVTGGAKRADTGSGPKDPTATAKVDTSVTVALEPRPLDGKGTTEVKGGVSVATDPLPVDPVEGKVTVGVEGTVTPTETQVEIDTGVSVGGTVDTGVDAGVEVATDPNAGRTDAGPDTSADLGAGPVDAGVDAGVDAAVDLSGGTADTSVGAATSLDTALVDTGVDTSLDAGLDASIDLTGSDAGADLGVDLLDTEVDLGLDLGGEATDAETAPTTQESGGLLGGVTGLLGGSRD